VSHPRLREGLASWARSLACSPEVSQGEPTVFS
jgi:hypothetical protein